MEPTSRGYRRLNTVQARLSTSRRQSQVKRLERRHVVDDSARRGTDGPTRPKAEVAMAHAPGVTVVIAGADALETSARALSFLTLFCNICHWNPPAL